MIDIPDKVAVGITLASAAVPSILTNDMSTPFVGVGMTTVAGAALGTYAAIGFDEATKPRGRLFFLATATIILASATTGVLPAWAGWHWINGGVQGGAAALAAVLVYYGLPEAIPTVRRLIREFSLKDLRWFKRTPKDPPTGPGHTGESDR